MLLIASLFQMKWNMSLLALVRVFGAQISQQNQKSSLLKPLRSRTLKIMIMEKVALTYNGLIQRVNKKRSST